MCAEKAEGVAAEAGEAEKKAAKKKKAKKRSVPVGIVYIHATFNNTIVTITDLTGGTVSWSSSGCHGFKGSRKSTPFAAQVAAQAAAQVAVDSGMRSASVLLKGPGSGRESALRALQSAGITVTAIRDITPIPHNGCRAEKRRRV